MNNIQYTAQFGNGVSGTIGLDDPTVFNRTAALVAANLSRFPLVTAATAAPANAYGGAALPTSSATSASIRPGVCSRFRLRRIA